MGPPMACAGLSSGRKSDITRFETLTMMTPMLVQYLVGLCCLRNDPDAVDVTVGDLVLDEAANKRRDVDVTVTVKDQGGNIQAFKATEVKHEGRPLDVETVEQLCAKLRDMPAVTHRAIVSSSHFTEAAINKAAAYGVKLFALKPWTEPIANQFPDFPNTGRPQEFFRSFESALLYWIHERIHLTVPSGPPSFNVDDSATIFTPKGAKHKTFLTMKDFKTAMYLRSTEVLWVMEPALTILRTFPTRDGGEFEVGPEWPHTHTLQVTNDKVFLKLDGKLCAIDSVTITGSLQWKKRKVVPQFYLLEEATTREIFAGAAVAAWGSDDGKMFAMIFPPESRTVGVHQFKLSEKHRNIIRGLKLRKGPSC